MNTRAHVEGIPKYNVIIAEVVRGIAAHDMASLLAIGGGCGRGMWPLPPKVEVFGIFNITTSVFYQFYS